MQVSELEQRQNYTNWHKNSEYCSQSFLHQPPTHPLTASLMLLMLILYCRRKYMVNNSKERLIFEKNTFWIKRQIYSDLRRFRGVETVLENTPPIGWNWHSVFHWFELSKDATSTNISPMLRSKLWKSISLLPPGESKTFVVSAQLYRQSAYTEGQKEMDSKGLSMGRFSWFKRNFSSFYS